MFAMSISFHLSVQLLHSDVLTEHFEEELSFLRSRLVGGLAGVGPSVGLSDVADGQHAAPALYPADDVLVGRLQLLPIPANKKNCGYEPGTTVRLAHCSIDVTDVKSELFGRPIKERLNADSLA